MYRNILFFLIMVTVQSVLAQGANDALPPKAFSKRVEKTADAVVIDVRTPEEYGEGHLKNAVNVDVQSDDFVNEISGLDKNKTYFVYCKAGVRSANAQEKMQEMGFRKVISMKGGIDEWKEQGLPVEE